MTITHDAPGEFQLSGHSISSSILSAPAALLRGIRDWHLASVQRRAAARLPMYLKRDIGEIDHLPHRRSVQDTVESYQDRLESMWMR